VPQAAKEEWIRDQDVYTAFFEGSQPDRPDVNWEEEMVLAVSLGERRSGGYSVEITKIIPETIGIMGASSGFIISKR
jgi:hypothetical protein